ncbi:MAG: hypothetical protein A3D16_05355 [Rhodobacterales bacterium RIFCSPHIGHO2_02_FULL_62_130]|nr:MAG: hypothetical protein A3D16_05355 [Rhodobacterales bacterium RIFCSPHIGHO2_02_FULL_62_130]OHC56693.1 MAG: hypothetical protein A3E48_07065 [Rhodobacterales bacterium RIFCSPHIGHO2_12_FULL_62_75]HCZ00809.1 exlusion protein FxsA [Rhodobacter sp.]
MWVFALFLAVPLIEIALFVTVGGWLTLWPTLAIVLLTGVLGAWLVRWQGMGVLRDLQRAQDEMRDPFSPLAHGALILLGGMLLILPGFFTDSLGLLLMIPPLRRVLIRYAASRIRFERFAAAGFARQRAPADDWVDAEFEEIVPERDKLGGPSKWTRH